MDERTEMDILLHDLRKSYIFNTTGPRWGEKFIHHKANNQCYKQNELMWQAAREEIPIELAAHANTNNYIIPVHSQIKPNHSV